MNRSRFGNRAIALSVIVAAIAPRLAIASSDAAPKSDPVTRCEDALRTTRGPSDLLPACAGLYSKLECRAAILATSPVERYLARVLDACARDYCPVLPEPRPKACAALALEGV